MINNESIRREIMFIMKIKFQDAKKILLLSKSQDNTFKKVGSRPMSSNEARRIVQMAIDRIKLIDQD